MMLQNADTLTSRVALRNLFGKFVTLLCTFIVLLTALNANQAHAQQDPFLVPIKSLNKIDPANVVQFKLVKLTTNGTAATAELEADTRGGFKIYDHGLRFEYKSPATLDSLLQLKSEARPPAKVVQDPFYNEPRAVHERGAHFILASDVPMDETGVIRIRFEACSVNTCLLPAYFLVQARPGSTSRPEPKGEKFGQNSSSLSTANAPSLGAPQSALAPAPPQTPIAPASTTEKTPLPSFRPEIGRDVSLSDSLTAEVQRSLLARSWLLFPALFLAGLLMNLTPCVYPMIPITLNVLSRSYQNETDEKSDKSRNTMAALMYVVGIILSYASMGVIAGMTGSLFGGLLQSKLVNGILAALMFALGLSMLDVFDLSKIQSAANRIPLSRKSPHLSVVTMGAVSGLVAAPCTGPVLSMLLLLVGQTKDPLYGFTLMSIFAAGFGAPYLFLGMLSQQIKRLPKASLAMTLVKNVFAALMFSLAIYYLKPLLQNFGFFSLLYIKPPLIGLMTIVLLTAIFFVLQLRKPTSPMRKIGLQAGLTILGLWLALSLIKGFISPENTNLPSLNRINDPVEIPSSQVVRTDGAQWLKNWNEAVQAAREQKKGLIVDAWAQWCAACLKMDAELWNEPGVSALINQHFIALKIDFTDSNPQSEELTKKWDLSGLPAVGIYPAGANFDGQPAILFREAATVSTFHQAVQKIFNGEIPK